MDIFGVKFSIALGAWRLRFVCMLEDTVEQSVPRANSVGRQIAVIRDASQVRLN